MFLSWIREWPLPPSHLQNPYGKLNTAKQHQSAISLLDGIQLSSGKGDGARMSRGLCLSSRLLVYLQEQASKRAEMPASGRPGYGTCGLLS